MRYAISFSTILIVICVDFNLNSLKSQAQLPFSYKDSKLSIDDRVKDLLGRMTLEEKVAQMECRWMEKPNDNSNVPKGQLPFGGNLLQP